MEIILIILTSLLLSTCLLCFFFIGYKVGKSHKENDAIEVDKSTAKVLKEYANLYSYDGSER